MVNVYKHLISYIDSCCAECTAHFSNKINQNVGYHPLLRELQRIYNNVSFQVKVVVSSTIKNNHQTVGYSWNIELHLVATIQFISSDCPMYFSNDDLETFRYSLGYDIQNEEKLCHILFNLIL